MKRAAVTSIAATLIALCIAAASGAASFDPAARTGFVSRGDVVSHLGQAGLVAEAHVAWTRSWDVTIGCSWADGTQSQATAHLSEALLFLAPARRAPSGAVTGYSFGSADLIDGEVTPGGWDTGACYAARAVEPDGTLVGTPSVVHTSPFRDALSFDGTPVPLTGHPARLLAG